MNILIFIHNIYIYNIGPWADTSTEWTPRLVEILGQGHLASNAQEGWEGSADDMDGKFWIPIQYLHFAFRLLHVCRVFDNIIDKSIKEDRNKYYTFPKYEESLRQTPVWFCEKAKNAWRGFTAQGSITRKNLLRGSDFGYLPQYHFKHHAWPLGKASCLAAVICTQVKLPNQTEFHPFGIQIITPSSDSKTFVQGSPVGEREMAAQIWSSPGESTVKSSYIHTFHKISITICCMCIP